jgi:hypothetical protein
VVAEFDGHAEIDVGPVNRVAGPLQLGEAALAAYLYQVQLSRADRNRACRRACSTRSPTR